MTEPAPDTQHEGVSLEADWTSASEVPIVPSNQFVAQVGTASLPGQPDGVYLTFGHVAPPILLGTPAEAKRAAGRLEGRLAVKVHSRLFITRHQLGELIRVLAETAEKFDAETERST